MSEPFLAEIRPVSFNFAPKGWALCNGQLLPINQNQALFAVLGTSFGGDGRTTFALPDLRGRVPMHCGGTPGAHGGEAIHTLTLAELPLHNHSLLASSTFSHNTDPGGKALGAIEAGGINVFHTADGTAALHPSSVTASGGNQPHENMQPYTVINFIIALQGIFPSQN